MELKFTFEEIGSMVNRRWEAAESGFQEIRKTRQRALEYYRQVMTDMPAAANTSNVCTSEVRDTVEALLPQILEPFVNGDAVVFTPIDAGDEKQARLETMYVNNVILEQNQGFNILATWFKDALIQKNGYVKCFWENKKVERTDEYTGVSVFDLQRLREEHGGDAQVSVQAYLDDEPVDFQAMPPEATPYLTFDIQITDKVDESKAKVLNVAPENMVIDPNHTSADLENCFYLGERIPMTRAEGREIGIPDVDNLPTFGTNKTEEIRARRQDSAEFASHSNREHDLIEIREHYIRCVFDESEELKTWRVITAGMGKALLVEEVDRHPYHSITPIQQPHQHYGLSAADLTMDIQRMATSMLRATLDSAIRSTFQRPVLSKSAMTERTASDLMNTHPMAPIVLNDVMGLQWTSPPTTIGTTLPMMERIDLMREERTGLSRQAQGLDATALADSTNLIGTMVMNQALQKVKLMLRTFAETGVRSLMLHIRELILKHESRQEMFELLGEYVELNVTEWRKKRNTKVKVGVGMADRLERITALRDGLVYAEKLKLGGSPLVSDQNLFNLLDDYYTESRLTGKGRYLTNPETIPPQPEENSPMEDALQIEEAKVVFDANLKAANYELDKFKALGDYQIKAANAGVNQFKAMSALPKLNQTESATNG